MAGGEGTGVTTGQPNLYKQDLAKLDVKNLTALSPEVISRQATINIGTIGHVAHGKSTVVKAISGVQTVRFKNELERNITIKLGTVGQEPERVDYGNKGKMDIEEMPAAEACPPPVSTEDINHMTEKGATSATVRSKNARKKFSISNEKIKRQKVTVDLDEPLYEVERIIDHRFIDGDEISYFVKWKGWPKENNTWEPEDNLVNCGHILKNYKARAIGPSKQNNVEKFKQSISPPTKAMLENLMKSFSSKGFVKYTLPKEGDINKKIIELLKVPEDKRDPALLQKVKHDLTVRAFHFTRLDQTKNLKEWEMEMNFISSDQAKILVENEVDLEKAPASFNYVNDYIPGEGVFIPEEPPIGCDCQPTCSSESGTCCGEQSGGTFAYGPDRRLVVPIGTPIYECNKRCKCDPNCRNRVVQKGRMVKLCIFRTPTGCGWGVKALQPIKKGTFVCEYVGEVIQNEEAERRGKIYDAEGRTYLFDLDYNDNDQNPYTVDAAMYGNISHFINHSCEPNLAVYAVWINCLDPNLPKLALFATRNIKDGEEITFDYMCQSLKGKNNAHAVNGTTPDALSESAFSPFTSPTRVRLMLPKSEKMENSLPESQADTPKTRCKCASRKCRQYLF